MKNIFKILSVILVLALAFSFAACNKADDDRDAKEDDTAANVETTSAVADDEAINVDNSDDLEKWLESEAGEIFAGTIVSAMANMADVKVSAEGDTLVIKMDIYDVDDTTPEMKSYLDAYYADQIDSFKSMMGAASIVPGLKTVEFKVCEEDGDYITSVKIDI